MVLTEGFLVYLSAREVTALARELVGARVDSWVLDIPSPAPPRPWEAGVRSGVCRLERASSDPRIGAVSPSAEWAR